MKFLIVGFHLYRFCYITTAILSLPQIVLLAAVCAAEPPSSYGAPPQQNFYPPPSHPSSSYGAPSFNQFNSGSHHGGRTEITKDIYVHVPPHDEPEDFEGGLRKPVVHKKNYKIIFIKAPSVNIDQMARFQQQAQQEEKTIVYVLSKKPELNTILEAQKNNQNKPSKPEVYFIKYKAQKENNHANVDINAPYQ